MTEAVQEIYTDRIKDPKDPMRSELERNSLHELADNITQNGLINPITVRPVGEFFEVVAGHRRLAACKIAGKIKIACVVRELNDQETFAIMAAENLERADVDPVDEAIFIARFMDQTKKSVGEVAKALRRSVQYVESRLAVGKMPDYMQQHIRAATLKLGAALALVRITDDDLRRYWVDLAARDGVSVAQAEYWVTGWELNRSSGGAPASNPPDGFQQSAPPVVKFRCAIDGQEYDASTFKPVMIHNENLEVFYAFVKAYNTPAPETVSSSSANPTTTPH